MKQSLVLLLLFILQLQATAQINYTEKFRKELAAHPAEDTFRVNRLNEMSLGVDLSWDESKKISTEALSIAMKIGYAMGKAMAMSNLGFIEQEQGNVARGVKMMNEADVISDSIGDPGLMAFILSRKGGLMTGSPKSPQYNLEGEKIATQIGNQRLLLILEAQIATYYLYNIADYPKILAYLLKALSDADQSNDLAMKIYIYGEG